MCPSPLNPFAIDFKYFEGLPLVHRVIASGAMAHFLQKVVTSGDHAYNARGTVLYYLNRRNYCNNNNNYIIFINVIVP